MRITPHGAAGGEVTGSAYLVETDSARVLVDFGMFQGGAKSEQNNKIPKPLDVPHLDAVLVTHGHLDHCGRLPMLPRAGFHGAVFATPATGEMCGLILRDSAKVQAQDVLKENRRRQRAGRKPVEPAYNVDDVEQVLERFCAAEYHQPVEVAKGIEARFYEAGHMLGSSSIRLDVQENGKTATVVFSGDLGPRDAPILRDAEPFDRADAVFLESTYGDRNHKPLEETVHEFLTILKQAVENRAKVLCPTFAVGRAQLLLVILAWAFRHSILPKFPVFLDSPMAIEATKIYANHPELFDEQLTAMIQEKPLRDDLNTLVLASTAEDSKAINDVSGPAFIMAGAGMCNAGRILHHLRQNLWKPETHVMIVGYQAPGTLGRQLVDHAKSVSIFGEKIAVRATVHTLGGFSAHAGQDDLLHWFGRMAACKPRTFLVHGETEARAALAAAIRNQYGLDSQSPAIGETIQL